MLKERLLLARAAAHSRATGLLFPLTLAFLLCIDSGATTCRAQEKPTTKPSPLDRLQGRPGEVVASLSGKRVEALAFSANGKWLASGDTYGNVLLRDTSNLQEPIVVKKGTDVHPALWLTAPLVSCVAFSPDSKMLAAASGGTNITVWELGEGKPTEKATLEVEKDAFVQLIAFSPDGKNLASIGTGSPGVRLWDLSGDQPKQRVLFEAGIFGVHAIFAPDGKTLVLVTAGPAPDGSLLPVGLILMFDVTTGKQRTMIEGLKDVVNWAAYSPDGQTLAAGLGGFQRDSTVRLFDLSADRPRERAVLDGHGEYGVRFVEFAPDGKTLVSAGVDGRIILWDAATGKMVRQVLKFGDSVMHAALAPDGRHMATGFRDGSIRIVRLR